MKLVKWLMVFAVAATCGVTISTENARADGSSWLDALDGFLVRARLLHLNPDVSSSVTPIGGSIEIDSDTTGELDFSYFITPNIAAELILATTRHDVRDDGSTLGNVDLGEVSLLPPILTLQYHIIPDAVFRPYVGAGINYTIFYDESSPRGTVNSVDYENSFGYALQAGFDYGLDDHWALNFDLKKLFLSSDVSLNGGAITADVDLDPWIFGAGIAYRF